MKKLFILMLVLSALIASCHTAQKSQSSDSSPYGTWELHYISGPRIAFNGLYPGRKPTIIFRNDTPGQVSGNTSCNSFSGPVKWQTNSVSFPEPLAMTKMFCEGNGEIIFLEMLKKVNRFVIKGNTMNLSMDDIILMKFSKIE